QRQRKMPARKVLGHEARDLYVDLEVLEIRDWDVEVGAKNERQVVFTQRALVDQQRAKRNIVSALRAERPRQLLIIDESLVQENLSKWLMSRRRCLAGPVVRLDCHRVMFSRVGVVGNGELPNLMGSLSRLRTASIPHRRDAARSWNHLSLGLV